MNLQGTVNSKDIAPSVYADVTSLRNRTQEIRLGSLSNEAYNMPVFNKVALYSLIWLHSWEFRLLVYSLNHFCFPTLATSILSSSLSPNILLAHIL